MKAEYLGVGAIVSGLFALSCCGSALLFLLFGVSMASVGFLDVLAPYQLWFQLAAVALLLAAWIRLWRRRACLRNSRRSFWTLVAITLALVGLLALPYMDLA